VTSDLESGLDSEEVIAIEPEPDFELPGSEGFLEGEMSMELIMGNLILYVEIPYTQDTSNP
jgi:hypothetical protein